LYQQYPANARPAIPATLQPITITKEKKKAFKTTEQLHVVLISFEFLFLQCKVKIPLLIKKIQK